MQVNQHLLGTCTIITPLLERQMVLRTGEAAIKPHQMEQLYSMKNDGETEGAHNRTACDKITRDETTVQHDERWRD